MAIKRKRRSVSKTHSPLLQAPILMLPSDQEGGDNRLCFFNLAEKKVYSLKNIINFGQSRCVGSSHGRWLLLSNEKEAAHIRIFNPFSGFQTQIPISGSAVGKYMITKAVLSSDPIGSNNDYGVVAIYSFQSKIAFLKSGDSTKWTDLEGKHQPYSDIICYKDYIYALANTGSVEIWDFKNSTPKRKIDIEPSFPEKKVEFEKSLEDLYSSQYYLVESLGDLLLVVRYVGNFVREDGELVREADLLGDEDSPIHLVCPYMTKMFHVYKLDFDQKKWAALESLGDRVLFLGGNHSMSLSARDFPGCEENSIYFTDDYWDRMDEHDMYGGHDMGVFNLQDGSIKQIYESDLQRFEQPPFWVVPNPL